MKFVLVPHEQFVLFQEAYKQNQSDETVENSIEKIEDHSFDNAEKFVRLLPKQIQKNSALLLEHMKDSRIFWDSNGELNVCGLHIPGSHVCNILHFMQYKSKQRPTGILEVLRNLRNTPKYLIANSDIQNGGGPPPPPGIPDKRPKNNESWAEQWLPL